jgi:hypothetical protein
MDKADEILYGDSRIRRQHSRLFLPLEPTELRRFQARVRYAPGPDDSTGLVLDETLDGQPIAFIDLVVCEGEHRGLKVQADLPMEGLGEERFFIAAQIFGGTDAHKRIRSISDPKLKIEMATECLAKGLDRRSVIAEIYEHSHIGFHTEDFILNSAEPL